MIAEIFATVLTAMVVGLVIFWLHQKSAEARQRSREIRALEIFISQVEDLENAYNATGDPEAKERLKHCREYIRVRKIELDYDNYLDQEKPPCLSKDPHKPHDWTFKWDRPETDYYCPGVAEKKDI